MARNIMILNGAPRATGNTMAMIEAFTQGAESAGHTVTRFDLQKMNIHPCLGCCGGGKDPASPCVQKDDMDQIYAAFKAADTVVFASPMYYWGISGQLKCAIDRMYAIIEIDGGGRGPARDCALLMPAGAATQENFEPVLQYYKAYVHDMKWTDLGYVYAGGNYGPGAIRSHPDQLEAARALGASI